MRTEPLTNGQVDHRYCVARGICCAGKLCTPGIPIFRHDNGSWLDLGILLEVQYRHADADTLLEVGQVHRQ